MYFKVSLLGTTTANLDLKKNSWSTSNESKVQNFNRNKRKGQ